MSLDVLPPRVKKGEPAWQTALLFPRQGDWTDEDYFAIEGSDNRLKELSAGCLEVLPMPTLSHQLLLQFLLQVVQDYLQETGTPGKVVLAPLPVRLFPGTIREPDLIYLNEARFRRTKDYPDGADLVMEIVSGSAEDRRRDLVTKRREYARAAIAEYWIIDPEHARVTVLTLNKKTKRYRELGTYATSAIARSKMFAGLQVMVDELFRAGRS